MHQIETNYEDKYVLDIRKGNIKADITRIESSDRGKQENRQSNPCQQSTNCTHHSYIFNEK